MPQEELLDLFAQDADELVRDLEQALMQLEEAPEDPEIVNRIFRAAHTIKGNAGIVGLTELASFTHRLETALDAVRNGKTPVDEALISSLLQAVDVVRTMVEALPDQLGPDDIPALNRALARLDGEEPSTPSPERVAPRPEPSGAGRCWEIDLRFGPDLLQAGHDPLLLIEELALLGTLDEVEVHSAGLPGFGAMDPGQLYLAWTLRLRTERDRSAIEDLLAFVPGGAAVRIEATGGREQAPQAPPPPSPTPAADPVQPAAASMPAAPFAPAPRLPSQPTPSTPPPPSEPPPQPAASKITPAPAPIPDTPSRSEGSKSESIRVHVQVLDKLMSLAGEMVLTRNQLLQGTQHDDTKQVERAAQRVDLLTAELQDAVMATRMQPIRKVLDKFKRLVRDLARSQGKRVRLVIEDEGVELDKTVIEAITDPLAHLVRNAVDHGIEPPQERLRAGKPEEGILRLHAAHRAGQVLVEVTDDGRGVDLERVCAKAVSNGLLSPHQAATLSPRAIRDLVFRPGFSTAETVTELSGRGVGLDVVHTNLSAIGGTVQLESLQGQGSTFRVKLPLTLAILPSLLVEAEGERFAIPQVHLVELLRISPGEVADQLERLGGVEVLRRRNALLPLVRLRELLGIEAPTWRDDATDERQPDRRRNIADRRAGTTATPAQLERRRSGDRRQSPCSAVNIAVLAAGDDSFGLVLDSFLDSAEIVVKPLGRHLRGCACYAGATVLGDGHAALILDVAGMAREGAIAEKSDQAEARARLERQEEEHEELIELLLLEGAEGELFGLPLDLVERVERIPSAAIRSVGGRRVTRLGQTSVPVFSMDQVASTLPMPERASRHLAVFQLGGREMGLLVSDIIDIVQVAADIDLLTHRQPGISGSLVYGPQDVLLVDLRELVYTLEPSWKQALGSAPSGEGRKHLLVVEDSSFFLNHIAAMLEEEGYEVAKAEHGAMGLELLVRNPERWDLVLTDIEMPEMDGFEMVERIRARPEFAALPIIAITSLMGPEARQRGRDAGIDEYSIKLDRDHVLERVRHLLRHGRA
jgi:two-component system chemotaxis sensor kinase CheA